MLYSVVSQYGITLYTPSRLKGIETKIADLNREYHTHALYTPSRLKGIETRSLSSAFGTGAALYTPSRLKGIETEWDVIIR